MNPRHWVHRSASMLLGVAAAACLALPSMAQVAGTARRPVELPPDPIARSPRLLGMGRLTLLADRDNHIDFWDFAGNPVGIVDADSVSVIDVRPGTSSSSASHTFAGQLLDAEQQEAASRDSRVSFEALRRPRDGTVYGMVGELNSLRSDEIYSSDSERRSLLASPLALPMVAGRLPFLSPNRMRYALVGIFGVEDSHDEYRRLVENSVGRYIDHSGTLIPGPNLFTPDEYFVQRVGGAAAVSYEWSRALRAAIGGNMTANGITGANEGDRYAGETRERRPIYSGQTTLLGALGKSVEWGVDGQAWTGSSHTTWVFTISTTQPPSGIPPLAGRGDLLKREEGGNRLRVRARWTRGELELGGSGGTMYRKIRVTPAPLGSPSSFNSFRLVLFSKVAAADTLLIPEDVLSSLAEERAWEAAGGISTGIRHRRGVAGVEYHFVQRRVNTLTGQGAFAEEVLRARQIATETQDVLWDVRGGIEYRCTEVLSGRAGYIYRTEDRDQLTAANEFASQTASAGIGVRPVGAHWTFDTGFAFEWGRADYGTPTRPRSNRQQLGLQVRWEF